MNIRWPSKNFWHRTVLGGLCTTITAALIAVSHLPLCGWLFVAGITVVQLVALSEYIQLCKIKGFSPAAPFLYWTGSAYLFLHYLAMTSPAYASLPPLLLFAGIFATGYWYFKNQKDAMANLALTAFAFVYICLPTSWLLDINFLATTPSNAPTSFWIIWLLVITKGGDMVAYLCGKILGRRPLAPSISPKKTIEGAIFGIAGSAAFSVALSHLGTELAPSFSTWAILGAVVGAVAIGGDLFESLLKRDAGVKDSNSIPGLGGVLDILDSLFFATPFLFLYLTMTGCIGTR